MYVACRYAKQGLSNFPTTLSSKRSVVGTTTSDQKGAHGIHDTQRGTLSLANARREYAFMKYLKARAMVDSEREARIIQTRRHR